MTTATDQFSADGDAFVYRQTDGGYLLYHFGTDGDDDAGRPPTSNWYGAPITFVATATSN